MIHLSARSVARLREAGVVHFKGYSWPSGDLPQASHFRQPCHVSVEIGGTPVMALFDQMTIGAESRIYEEFTGDELPEITPSEADVVNAALAEPLSAVIPTLSNHVKLRIDAALSRGA